MNEAKPVAPISQSEKEKKLKLGKKRLVLLVFLVLIIITAILGYVWKKQKDLAATKEPTVTVNGKKIPATFLKNPIYTAPRPVDYNQEAQALEAKIAIGEHSYQDYLALAQTYAMASNKVKAIEYYEKAKQAANPKMENYDSFLRSMEDVIKQLKASN